MQNTFVFCGRVRSSPVFLESQKTGNKFVKFTISISSDMPWGARKKIIERENGVPEDNFGETFVDCMVFPDKYERTPANYILEKVKVGDIVSGAGRICSGKRPKGEEGSRYRPNWVYGDYLYCRVYELRIERYADQKKWNPYGRQLKEMKNAGQVRYPGARAERVAYRTEKRENLLKKKPPKNEVSDEDIIFTL